MACNCIGGNPCPCQRGAIGNLPSWADGYAKGLEDGKAQRAEVVAPKDAERYRWLNKQHNMLMYIEGMDEMRNNVRLRCGEPLDKWIDARIEEERNPMNPSP